MVYAGFRRSLPQISIFHNPMSPPSVKVLGILRSTLTSSYPPSNPKAPPLQFDLDVVEGTPPTPDQFKTILSYLDKSRHSSSSVDNSTPPLSVFLSAHPSTPQVHPTTPTTLSRLVAQNPNALRWPIVVDWIAGRASVGDLDGVTAILEGIRRKRDGEEPADGVEQPKGWFS
ncbi:hypothetical protein BJ138DRAFT_1125539 [Hygrophoropsis aurantiaca]|uniref:Uncharacterized protein n=1 Tax=Hygrophoropsis aurantiaca TaxID=72124 RepID=A0ACB8AEV4_9AGAM|nr:hypothetical protein BJ138DRAFT_1125539 [Hygrophoropsis aurantiaca]